MHCSAKMDASERDSGKWMDTRCLLSTFPELVWLVVGLLVSYPYQNLLSQNNSCKWLPWCLARVGGFNQCASPNSTTGFLQQESLASHSPRAVLYTRHRRPTRNAEIQRTSQLLQHGTVCYYILMQHLDPQEMCSDNKEQ